MVIELKLQVADAKENLRQSIEKQGWSRKQGRALEVNKAVDAAEGGL